MAVSVVSAQQLRHLPEGQGHQDGGRRQRRAAAPSI
jgi:hypothetical protein